MKALLCTHYGPPDDLELAELPDPRPGAGEAVVRVKAAALNFFDTLIIAGKYQHKPAFPFSPAAEFAGEVESVGSGVTGFSPGDRVIGNIGWGAAREKALLAAEQLVAMPAGLDFDRAAAIDLAGRDVIVLDDEIAKGSTVLELLERLREQKVQSIRIACTHGLFSSGALDRLGAQTDVAEIVCTNTVPIAAEKLVPKLKVLSIAPALAEAMRRIHNGESVSTLFHA